MIFLFSSFQKASKQFLFRKILQKPSIISQSTKYQGFGWHFFNNPIICVYVKINFFLFSGFHNITMRFMKRKIKILKCRWRSVTQNVLQERFVNLWIFINYFFWRVFVIMIMSFFLEVKWNADYLWNVKASFWLRETFS